MLYFLDRGKTSCLLRYPADLFVRISDCHLKILMVVSFHTMRMEITGSRHEAVFCLAINLANNTVAAPVD